MPTTSHAQQATSKLGPCARLTDDRTTIVQQALQRFLDRADTLSRRIRVERLLPAAPGANARLVEEAATCRRLRRAVDSLSGLWQHPSLRQPDSTRALFVFQVDTLFVLIDLDGVRPEARSDWQVFHPAGRRTGQWR